VRSGLGISGDEVVVGSLLRLARVKGPQVLVEAAALARARARSRLRFLVLGDGELRARLEARVRELGLGGCWIFAGQRGDVYEHLAAMDVYVQPSLNEGMGRAVIQAQAMALPVVASRVCGLPDAVREEDSALLVAPGDPEALARPWPGWPTGRRFVRVWGPPGAPGCFPPTRPVCPVQPRSRRQAPGGPLPRAPGPAR